MPSRKKKQQDEPSTAGGGGSGTATKAKPKEETKEKVQELPPYHVVLLNDDDHSYEYVIEMLKSIFGHPAEMGYKLAQQVDERGRAVVLTTHKEKAELKREQILAWGPDPRMSISKGSLGCYIEPAPTD